MDFIFNLLIGVAAGFLLGRVVYLKKRDVAIEKLTKIRDNLKEDFEFRQIAIDDELKVIRKDIHKKADKIKYGVYGSIVLEKVEEEYENA